MLDTLPRGAGITIKLADGTEIAGPLQGRDGDKILIGDPSGNVGLDSAAQSSIEPADVGKVSLELVDTVLLDVGSPIGPE